MRSVQIDSRILTQASTALFVAIKTDHGNGHQFIADAYAKGVRNFLVEEKKWKVTYPEANFFLVDDVIQSLQYLAKTHRAQFSIPVIGIAGSNGKTIVKEWLSELLEEKYFVHKSPGSFNSQIGVPLAVFPLHKNHEIAILEAGISTSGEMENLSNIIDCELGIFTFLGKAHDAGFRNQSEKLIEKIKLFKNAKTIIYSIDNKLVATHLEKTSSVHYTWSWSNSKAYCFIEKSEPKFDGSQLYLRIDGIQKELWVPFKSKVQIENVISSILAAIHYEIPFHNIKNKVEQLAEVDMRLTLTKGINNTLLVHDYYNADLHSLEVALDFMDLHANQRKKVLVLSELSQTQLNIEDIFRLIQKYKSLKRFDTFIGIGKNWAEVIPSNSENFHAFDSSQDFIKLFDLKSLATKIILLKGARKHRFEFLSKHLRFQEHSARLEVNLTRLKENLDFFRLQIKPPTLLMAMVKASAYGSGSVEVSSVLAYNQVDYLCVAYVDEGVELRQHGISIPIMVLNAEIGSFEKMVQYDLEPEVYKKSQIDYLAGMSQTPAVHLKLDSGMNRLGFKPEQVDKIGQLISSKNIKVKSIFSHLSSSDNEQQDAFSLKQIKRFGQMADQIEQLLGYQPIRHILNTNGILRFPEYHLDMVRLGIGLYGLGLTTEWTDKVQSIFSLKATVSQIKKISAGESVGYNRKYIAAGDMTIGTVNLGYADGLLRKAGNGQFSVQIDGKMVKTVGNICMDMFMIDLTSLDQVAEGDEVIIFSDNQSIERLSSCLDTIAYEVLTNISSRIPRIYLRG